MVNWRYYRIASLISLAIAIILGLMGNESGFYEYGVLALFFELKEGLQAIRHKY